MLLEIFIIQEGSSLLLLRHSFTKKKYEINGNLFSGLISALSMFTSELEIGDIKYFQTGELRVFITSYKKLIFVGLVEEDPHSEIIGSSLKKIRESFLEDYSQEIENWKGKISIFEGFRKKIDEIVYGDFSKLFIEKDFPKHVIRVIRKFQSKFEPKYLKLIGEETGLARAASVSSFKSLKKHIRKELNLFSINNVSSSNEQEIQIDIPMCPICRGIKSSEFSCKFLEGFIEGYIKKSISLDSIQIKETQCIAHGDEQCRFKVNLT
ncbi:V4R domain-containing protein [Promethearchaeum syntrophicum]|uniref:V4R domain-containing protein n=1 Tax=Promethearchaeum syntrophicum TaxID=2594042 RepID=A0A5B9D7F2_9ARCH|nr:4-vinyl reductase [Candidatus Prometheoarchaeum syntrophicum]QEE15089.1 V4R domain protein [Candidatus Prometheoarchaeum syntrophicum]